MIPTTPLAMFSAVFVSLLGTVLLIWAKKQASLRAGVAGVALCVLPMAVASVALLWLLVGATLGGLYVSSRAS